MWNIGIIKVALYAVHIWEIDRVRMYVCCSILYNMRDIHTYIVCEIYDYMYYIYSIFGSGDRRQHTINGIRYTAYKRYMTIH